jgi:cytidylate kinase
MAPTEGIRQLDPPADVLECVVIDGPAGAGKSSVARALAQCLGWRYFNTGQLFRSLALVSLERPLSVGGLAAVARGSTLAFRESRVMIDGRDVTEDLARTQVATEAARLGHEPEIVRALIDRQRAVLAEGGYVADGRNLGADVVPNAALKIFLTASPLARARRRSADTGQPLSEVLREHRRRDDLDETRKVGALRIAPGAHVIDSTDLSFDQVLARIAHLARGSGLIAGTHQTP